MKRLMAPTIILALFAAAGAVVWKGQTKTNVSLASASEIWGDLLRDADQFGFKLTRLSDARETELGDRLAAAVIPPATEPAWESYVSAVGATLQPNVRRKGIRYRFHVVRHPDINAFALPGGHIVVFTGLLEFIHSEAELASILGHEMSHVDLRHAVELYQWETRFKFPGGLVEMVRTVTARGYSKYQESEADDGAFRLLTLAGYNPMAESVVFLRMEQVYMESQQTTARTPAGELVLAIAGSLRAYYQTHPSNRERTARVQTLIERNRGTLAGRTFYEGVTNYLQRVPRAQQRFPQEEAKPI